MADWPQTQIPASTMEESAHLEDDHIDHKLIFPRSRTFLMRGLNAGSNYVHWESEGEPDVQALQAPEPIPDLGTVTIVGEW